MATPDPTSVAEQFVAVWHAPVPFILVCFGAGVGIWWALNWLYSAKVTRLEDSRDHYKEKLDRAEEAAKRDAIAKDKALVVLPAPAPASQPEPKHEPETRRTGISGLMEGIRQGMAESSASVDEVRPTLLSSIVDDLKNTQKSMERFKRTSDEPLCAPAKKAESRKVYLAWSIMKSLNDLGEEARAGAIAQYLGKNVALRGRIIEVRRVDPNIVVVMVLTQHKNVRVDMSFQFSQDTNKIIVSDEIVNAEGALVAIRDDRMTVMSCILID